VVVVVVVVVVVPIAKPSVAANQTHNQTN